MINAPAPGTDKKMFGNLLQVPAHLVDSHTVSHLMNSMHYWEKGGLLSINDDNNIVCLKADSNAASPTTGLSLPILLPAAPRMGLNAPAKRYGTPLSSYTRKRLFTPVVDSHSDSTPSTPAVVISSPEPPSSPTPVAPFYIRAVPIISASASPTPAPPVLPTTAPTIATPTPALPITAPITAAPAAPAFTFQQLMDMPRQLEKLAAE